MRASRAPVDLPGRNVITVASRFGMPKEHADATTCRKAAFALRS
jgi:hypothetical protein